MHLMLSNTSFYNIKLAIIMFFAFLLKNK